MKKFAPALLILGALTLTSCKDDIPQSERPVTEITITGDDKMRFSEKLFTVKANTEITLTFYNEGRMPKETMGHNLAIIDQSVPVIKFAVDGARHPRNEYIDPAYQDKVIATTKVLGPKETEILRFTAPGEPGDYPYVCSFPGHAVAGMKGIMKVVK